MRARTALLATPLALLGLAACGGGDGGSGKAADSPKGGAKAATSVKVAQSDLGPILVDQQGRTLYAFTKDKDRASNCDADCIAVWPALTGKDQASAGKGADKALLGKAERTKGAVQTTYGQWPLYYYVGDSAAGDTSGQGLDGEWFVVGADGKLIRKSA
ncbi:COG4315 family predicted lipoprotein [Wenjunlia tyrosinilytica]|uniref:Lipoprotein with Yx(FWY)xxD motif n=1 Tax=Wenjunlia tyrosinilytica TaxID=1544741 RepID=A0A918DZY0_9ACTN|nr:hypothetical protein [Wenjunlia tyrosinilytica]GGO92854.1 hypothetical protein GCM10012280_43980 [Wenjunlia tyrosinilytica]